MPAPTQSLSRSDSFALNNDYRSIAVMTTPGRNNLLVLNTLSGKYKNYDSIFSTDRPKIQLTAVQNGTYAVFYDINQWAYKIFYITETGDIEAKTVAEGTGTAGISMASDGNYAYVAICKDWETTIYRISPNNGLEKAYTSPIKTERIHKNSLTFENGSPTMIHMESNAVRSVRPR